MEAWGSVFVRNFMIRVYQNRFEVVPLDSVSESVTIDSTEPFSTPRLLVGDFSLAESALQKAMRSVVPRRWFGLLAPRVSALIHPVEMAEGGLSQVEHRVLEEIAEASGIGRVVIWCRPELSAPEALGRLRAQG